MFRWVLVVLFSFGCSDVEDAHDHHHHEHELITTVQLTFTDAAGDAFIATWADSENDGSPEIDPVQLAMGETYAVSVRFLNELESPAEDITPEVEDESDQHQVFFTGSGVQGPASAESEEALVEHSYLDEDPDGLPLGLESQLDTLRAGEGELVVTLRHMPLEDGNPIKAETTAADVAAGGFESIGGDNDASVTFSLTVE
jgi:hypothetical protein